MRNRFFAGLAVFIVVGLVTFLCFAGTTDEPGGRATGLPTGITANNK